MRMRILYRMVLVVMTLNVCFIGPAYAQLNSQFGDILKEILDVRLRRSIGVHGTHFLLSAAEANQQLTPALNSLISSNIASFPLSSTAAAVSFDFSSGAPVSVLESLGPIFSEDAETIGKGRVSLGVNYSYLDLSRFRGLATEDMRFTFTHQDITGDSTLGDNPTEDDYINLVMGMQLKVSLFVIYGSIGITDNLEVGVALPITNVSLSGDAVATINSFTFSHLGAAYHQFGQDSLHPVLVTHVPYSQAATGLGDIALRIKYAFPRGHGLDFAALGDVRLPTGKTDDYMGTGQTSFRVLGIISKKFSDFTPHLNLGYEYRSAEFESSRMEFRLGFDDKMLSGFTFVCDFLGTVDLQTSKAIHLFPGTKTITENVFTPSFGTGSYMQKIDLSNIPDRSNDNTFSLSVGFKYAPSDRVIVIGNVIAPLNDGGLRADIAPTIGLNMSF